MQKRSSDFAGVRFLDKDKVINKLRDITARLCKENNNIQGMYLFGSLVKNSYKPGSDADILVILKKDKKPMPERIQEYLRFFLSAPVPVDVFVYTAQELDNMKTCGNRFIAKITAEAVKLN
ncbi:MAG: nucleotidyltransferase domain-containing protein [Candidatus Omnitrophica bacterium]|nr:nucleotidyltransferase domain-containing protein [Candidatus Omnitrophota bacterium]